MSDVKNKRVVIYIDQSAAEDSLERLQTKANGFNTRIKNAREEQELLNKKIKEISNAGGDITKLQNRYDELGRKVNGYNKDLKIVQVEQQKLKQQIDSGITPSFSQLERYVARLRNELKNLSQSAPEYAEKFESFKKASGQLKQLGDAMNGVKTAQRNWFQDAKTVAFGVLIGNTIQSALTAVGGYLSGLISGNAKLSDSLSDVEKAANLTAAQAKQLNSELGRIDTRTSNENLRQIAIGLGQIGQAANKVNVEAIDKIVVALGDEFGGGAKEITTVLSVLRNNLSDIKTGNYAEDVGRIGNALNTLGAEGLATAPVVTDISNRIAGIGRTFKLTSGQILGVAATFQELGIETERGATAITKLFQKIGAEPAKFAKVAGMGIKEFAALVNKDMLGAFQAVAAGAKKAGSNNIEFSKILKELDADGSGAGEVLSKLGANSILLAQKVNTATTALKGQNSITEEFSKKNNNLAADLEKFSKRMSALFTNSAITSFFSRLLKSVNGLIEPSKTLNEKFGEQVTLVTKLKTQIEPLLPRYDELAAKTNKNVEEQNEMKSIINQVASVIPGAITQFDKYGNAIAISTSRVTEFIKNEKDRLKVVNEGAIKEKEVELKRAESAMKLLKARQKEIEKNGTFRIYESNSAGIDGLSTDRAATQKEIQEQNNAMIDAISRVNGLRQEIARLNGDVLESTIKDQQKSKAAADKAAADAAKQAAEAGKSGSGLGVSDETKKKLEDAKNEYKKLLKEITDQLNKAKLSDYAYQFSKIFEVKKEQEDKLKSLFKLGAITKQQLDAGMELIFTETAAKLRQLDKTLDTKVDIKVQPNLIPDIQEEDLDAFFRQIQRSMQQKADAEKRNDRDKLAGLKLKVGNSKSIKSEADAKRDVLYEEMKQELLTTDATENEKLIIKQKYAALYNQIDEDEKKKQLDKVNEWLGYAQQALNFLDSLTQVRNARDQAAHSADMKRLDDKKKKNEQNLKYGLLTQQQYQIELNAINRDGDEKKRALEAKQFERTKKIQSAQALINGFLGVTAVLAAIPGPLDLLTLSTGRIMQIAFTLLTAGAQVAAINSQKPQFEKGGIAKGSRHIDGGISLVDSRSGQKVGEMEDGEPYMILSRNTYKNNKGIVDSLLYTSLNKNGASIQPEYKTRAYSGINIPAINQTILKRQRYEQGGVFNSTSAAQQVQQQVVVYSDPELKQMIATLMVRLNEPFIGVVSQKRIDDAADLRQKIVNAARP